MSTAAVALHLFAAPAAGAPMHALSSAELVPGLGIVGDRYAGGLGHWSDPRWPDQELTLMEFEVAADLALEPALFRRNVVTRGIHLEDLVGRRFSLGPVRLEGVRPCDPCRYLERLVRPGLFDALAGRGGLRARILSSGVVHPGDRLLAEGAAGHGSTHPEFAPNANRPRRAGA